ncbi:hypothetical protein GIW57_22755 [Stenotrophomonas sp. PA-6-5C]|uniref:hypothetical protein n=1 Tax=Stenotrophomonas sp. PA-6-5C TaxID=2665487 RepID=UPI001F39A991|nr:hypothetical protein [Stenotrophomonas sp. PA-6-5C]MCF5092982.1 hypothetical protein [Stenotrophomonas sp. PA-6-5C]
MRTFEKNSLKSEIAEVSRLLRLAGPKDVFTRIGLERRLKELTTQQDEDPGNHFQSRVTFKGSPVVGSYGISASFGAKAMVAFSDAVSAVGASLRGVLAARGPLPDRPDFEMLITGTAVGSFGFELESRNRELVEGGAVSEAVERAQILLEAASQEEDDALAEAVVDLDRRAIATVRAFAEILHQHGALCTVSTAHKTFSFSNSLEVVRSVARLEDANILEDEQTLSGVLIGVLPVTRTLEFRLPNSEVIRGKVDRSVGELETVHEALHKRSTVRVRTTQVGDGKTKYLFVSKPEVPDNGVDLLGRP